jgi:hypothetical protein
MSYQRVPITPNEIELLGKENNSEIAEKLYSNLAIPSYVHAYSLAIDYMYKWFESKFEKDFFVGGIYIDGKHVLDDYKNKFHKLIVKGQQPRARIEPRIQHDYDREGLDSYLAPVNMYTRRSNLNTSFFKDYDRDIFLGINMRALRMDFNFKVRVNTRAEQLDLAQRMELYFRVGATQYEDLSLDFHVPKEIMLNIADRAGFEIKRNEVVDIVEFLEYLNRHSDIPFLFKIRAINKKAEFFIRMNGLYTHIAIKDKLQLDDGDRNGKLDFYFHIDMNAVLTIPVPQFYAYYSARDLTVKINPEEASTGTVAIYSINVVDIPKVDEHGWIQAAVTQYATDKGEEFMDLSSLFTGENILAKTINHDLVNGVSPDHFINIKVFTEGDIYKAVPIKMDWVNKIAYFRDPQPEDILDIAIYYDREYLNELDISLENLNDSRISEASVNKSGYSSKYFDNNKE